MARVVVVGSINMDVVARAPKHPAPGETVLGSGLVFVPGGKGANQAVAACRLGAPTELVGRVGTDAFADLLVEFLSSEQVGTAGVLRLEGVPTGSALVVVDDTGENTIVVVPGANHALTPADAAAVAVASDDVVVVQFELPVESVCAALSRARGAGARTIVNPAPALPSPVEVLQLADFVVVNEAELAFFAGTEAVVPGVRALRRRPEQVVIATLGAGGATALIGDEVLHVAARVVPVVDTTGAGDCFVGALAAALCSWASVGEAVHFANLAASVAVQRLGAAVSMPRLVDVEALS